MNALYLEFSKSKAQGDRKQKSGKKLVNCLNSQRGLRNALTWQATDGNWQRNWFLLSLDIWRAVPSHLGIHQPPQRRHQHSGALDLPSSHFYLIRYLIRWYLLDILPWESHNRTSDVIKINGIFFFFLWGSECTCIYHYKTTYKGLHSRRLSITFHSSFSTLFYLL